MENHIQEIRALLAKSNYPKPIEINELPSSGGSSRIYYRVLLPRYKTKSILAAFNPDISENIAWQSFSVHFREKGLPVPEIYARDESYRYFLLQDLGDESLFDLLKTDSSELLKNYFREAITVLIRFQTDGYKGLDLDVAYPVKEFNKRSILWDLNYFKYYFVKPNEVQFDENLLENEFVDFANLLLKPKQDFFLYRDFQSRNILIRDKKLWFIDFQGGRKGPLQYDLVSLLYQAKANLSDPFREEMHQFYLDELEKRVHGITDEFNQYFPFFIYFRLMQVLGAYGFRGIIQRKGHFIESIPPAIRNLESVLLKKPLNDDFKMMKNIFQHIIKLEDRYRNPKNEKLTITINSFSYKKHGYPVDHTENGGGFVFDCRALPNPGRINELKDFTGREQPVIDYLSSKSEVDAFLKQSFRLVDQCIENYLDRGFTSLAVNFGCTGGKHRSVYGAEQLKSHLGKYSNQILVKLKHLQLDD